MQRSRITAPPAVEAALRDAGGVHFKQLQPSNQRRECRRRK